MPVCKEPIANRIVAACIHHLCKLCYEHPGSLYITSVKANDEFVADIMMCPRCVIGLNRGELEIKEGVDYLKGIRDSKWI